MLRASSLDVNEMGVGSMVGGGEVSVGGCGLEEWVRVVGNGNG